MTLPRHIPAELSRSVHRELECQARLASLEHDAMILEADGAVDEKEWSALMERLHAARAEWEEAVLQRRRLEEHQEFSARLDGLRVQVATQRSEMSRWERWREARRYRREVG